MAGAEGLVLVGDEHDAGAPLAAGGDAGAAYGDPVASVAEHAEPVALGGLGDEAGEGLLAGLGAGDPPRVAGVGAVEHGLDVGGLLLAGVGEL